MKKKTFVHFFYLHQTIHMTYLRTTDLHELKYKSGGMNQHGKR